VHVFHAARTYRQFIDCINLSDISNRLACFVLVHSRKCHPNAGTITPSSEDVLMNKEMMTDAIISAKVKQELTWEGIAGSIGLFRHEQHARRSRRQAMQGNGPAGRSQYCIAGFSA
jgi:hypothetical protein